jgi:hypothetical protein
MRLDFTRNCYTLYYEVLFFSFFQRLIGFQEGLKIPRWQRRVGSSPTARTRGRVTTSVQLEPHHFRTRAQMAEKTNPKQQSQRFSPSEWMRQRRPELFSDSERVDEPQLSPEVFGYQLDTLTSRKEEGLFENFARRLCEKEVCPNLVPQTGPTGGGDSKVDTETHPVAQSLAETWFEGIGKEAANERWGFAFSAKKEWLPKVRSDVAKAVATGRGYSRIFFITNQFVPDKKRSQIQDELSKQHGCTVTIFDRSWISDRIFSNHREQLAIDTLGLTNVQISAKSVVGPVDLERNKDLQQLEAEIGDPSRYKGLTYHRVEDCLVAARLARGLEKTRIDVEGRFVRARQLADKVGDRRQKLRVVYEHAWTEFWWYDDFGQLTKLYDSAENLAVGSEEISDVELLQNLWSVLFNSVLHGGLSPEEAKLEDKTGRLKAELDRLAEDNVRIISATRAKTQRLLIDLMEARHSGSNANSDATLVEFGKVLDVAANLGGYPLDHLVKIFGEIGPAFAESVPYGQLFEKLVSLYQERRSDAEGGRLLNTRGLQKLQAKKHQDALRLFGRAQHKLVAQENRQDLIVALFGCGMSYEGLGLPWAAWSSFVGAAVTSLAEFKERSVVVRSALIAVQRLEWLDLRLGRIPYVLAWRELGDMMATQIRLDDKEKEDFREERTIQDASLGVLILKSDLGEISKLVKLAPSFEELTLPLADIALDYAAGDLDKMKKESLIPEGETPEETETYFIGWVNQPIAADLPDRIVFLDEGGFEFRAVILGCNLVAKGESKPNAIHIAESLFAALEGFLATSLEDVQPYLEGLNIVLVTDDSLEQLSTSIERLSGEPIVKVKYPSRYVLDTPAERELFKDWLIESVIKIISTSMIMKDTKAHITKLAKDERVFSRALLFAEMSIGIENILGSKAKVLFADWITDADKSAPRLLRTEPWYKPTPDKEGQESVRFDEGDPPAQFDDLGNFGHRDRRISSIIDVSLWDKARWKGTAYLHYGPPVPPMLGILFTDEEAGRQIFTAWRKRFGSFDQNEEIRLVILTGIDQANPHAYRVMVGTNVKNLENDASKLIITASRFQSMEPNNSQNLDLFLQQQKLAGSFGLVPAFGASQSDVRPATDLVIGKTEIIVRAAWQVGENDPDIVALRPDDNVIIPEGEKEAPFLKALERLRKRAESKR